MDSLLTAKYIPDVGEIYEKCFVNNVEKHFLWLSEVYDQAKDALYRPGLELLPKTPSQKSKRVRQKRVIPLEEEVQIRLRLQDENNGVTKLHKRSNAVKSKLSTTTRELRKRSHAIANSTCVESPSFVAAKSLKTSSPMNLAKTSQLNQTPTMNGDAFSPKFDAVVESSRIEEDVVKSETKQQKPSKEHERSKESKRSEETKFSKETESSKEPESFQQERKRSSRSSLRKRSSADSPSLSTPPKYFKKSSSLPKNQTPLSSVADVVSPKTDAAVQTSTEGASSKVCEVHGLEAEEIDDAVSVAEEIKEETFPGKVSHVIHQKSSPLKSPLRSASKAAVDKPDGNLSQMQSMSMTPEQPRMTTRSKARPKVDRAHIAESGIANDALPQSPQRSQPQSTGVRPISAEKSGSRFFGFGSAIKNFPSTLTQSGSKLSSFYKTGSTTPSSNMPSNISSFLKRNTPLKMNKQDHDATLKEKLLIQTVRQEEARSKKEELMKQKIEEQKRKREERQQKVAVARQQQHEVEIQQKKRIEDKHNQAARLQKTVEAETLAKKRQEEERRRDEEQRQKAREEEHKLRVREQERQEAARRDAERLKAAKEAELKQKLAHEAAVKAVKSNAANVSNVGNQSRMTFVANSANVSRNMSVAAETETYDMTPVRTYKPSTDSNYDITDLNSDDETDDEEAPRKKIPFWAQGAALKAALVQQYYGSTDVEKLFSGAMKQPDLQRLFKYNRKRFNNRTSSAIWNASFQAFEDYVHV